MGRKSTFDTKVADAICERIAKGEPLRQICREEGMPAWTTVYNWINERPEFAERIARARDLGYEAIAEEALEIADDAKNDWMEKFGKEGKEGEAVGYEFNGEHVQRSKLRIETRLKLLAKWSPKKYGDKQQIEHSGKIGLEALVAGDE